MMLNRRSVVAGLLSSVRRSAFVIFQAATTTCVVDVTALSAGSFSANSIKPSCFDNPAATVAANTNWTPLSTQYLSADVAANYVVSSAPEGNMRDVELTTWTRQGYVYMRLDATGAAIYFYHNGESTNGTLEIGIVTGLSQSSYPSGTYFPLYQNADLVSTVPGYNKANTTGHYFTFGVGGFDIYVGFNGTEFCRFKEYRQMNAGVVALKSNSGSGYGFRSITLRVAPVMLFSDYINNEINLADWGIKSVQTTGTIGAGSASLTVASAANMRIGDFLIVEIGHEAGAGARGTIGVGGVWPAAHYANLATLVATSPATDTFAWQEDTGEIWRYVNVDVTISNASPGVVSLASNFINPGSKVYFRAGSGTLPTQIVAGTTYYCVFSTGSSFQVSATLAGAPINTSGGSGTVKVSWVKTQVYDAVHYYADLALPRSLRGRITAINGTTITLDTPATVAATGAAVYLDNQVIFNDILQTTRLDPAPPTWPRVRLTIPAGTFALGGKITGGNHTGGWEIKGQGQSQTFLTSVKGMLSAGITLGAFDGVFIHDFTISGNYGLSGYGLAYYDMMTPVAASSVLSQYGPTGLIQVEKIYGQVSETQFDAQWFTQGIFCQNCGSGAVVQDVTVNDVFQSAVEFQTTTNGVARRITVNINSLAQSYTQWLLEWAGVSDGLCEDCTVNGVGLVNGIEGFGATDLQVIRPILNNAILSMNNCGGFLVQDSVFTVAANSKSPMFNINGPLVTISTNAGSELTGAGGTINNINITIQDYIDSDNDIPVGIIINADNPNISINGGNYIAPDYAAPSTLVGPQGIRSDALNTTVSCFRNMGVLSSGSPSAAHANIGLQNGSVTNCVAPVIVVNTGTQSGNASSGSLPPACDL